MTCPKCGFENAAGAAECARCGVLFAKLTAPGLYREPPKTENRKPKTDPAFGPREWRILAFGFGAAVIAHAIPFIRMIFTPLKTLFHEIGHAIAAWLLGHPAIPGFDFIFGGGMTHISPFKLSIAIAIAAGFAYLGYRLRRNPRAIVVLSILFVLWLICVSSEWRRETVIAAAGVTFELSLSAVFLYMALADLGFKVPEVERPLAAFAAFFVLLHTIQFAISLRSDPDFLEWYREGKGGALMNDLEVVSLNLKIYLGVDISIQGLATLLLLFAFVPIAVAVLWYLRRDRMERVVEGLLTES